MSDTVIYQQFKGKFTKIAEPRLPNNYNFVILWKGMDWSGFRDLAGCEKQFAELESQEDATKDNFSVVER